MELRLDGKVALVTGSDSGIGREIARCFAAAGADVTVTYHTDRDGAEETAANVRAQGRRATVARVDVGVPEEVERLFAAHDEAFGRIDILVNNAGFGIHGEVAEMPFDSWERVIRTNLHGPFLCSQQAARRMLARGEGGRMIHITSVHEEACWTGASSYCASKAGLRNLMRTLAIELGPHGITSNGIAPGMILTPMNKQAAEDPDYLREAEAQIVVRRVGQPNDIAQMALFLASDAASYCTGATYYVDGGWMLTWPPV
ncbi:MAG: glucose 1-dehydrogenase [Thermomicrobiales bacterium]|nr:glucose 1-dehydrogenase [Thermomicrobiales bacterium]